MGGYNELGQLHTASVLLFTFACSRIYLSYASTLCLNFQIRCDFDFDFYLTAEQVSEQSLTAVVRIGHVRF